MQQKTILLVVIFINILTDKIAIIPIILSQTYFRKIFTILSFSSFLHSKTCVFQLILIEWLCIVLTNNQFFILLFFPVVVIPLVLKYSIVMKKQIKDFLILILNYRISKVTFFFIIIIIVNFDYL